MVSRIAVASRSRFDLLQQDDLDSSESEDEIQVKALQTAATPKQDVSEAPKRKLRDPPVVPAAQKPEVLSGIAEKQLGNALDSKNELEPISQLANNGRQRTDVAPLSDLRSPAKTGVAPLMKDTQVMSKRPPLTDDGRSDEVSEAVQTVPAFNKGVKFQDGLSPGQGDDGETIIPGVDKHNTSMRAKDLASQVTRKESKHRNLIERTTWTFIMIAGFIVLLCMGHPYMILLVMLCQTLVYKEVTALFQLSNHGDTQSKGQGGFARRERWNKTLNWYFFVVTNYFLYGESIIYYFKHVVFVDSFFLPFARNHRFISFMLYIFGFMAFVANLQKQYLRQQFALFCWVHMTLLVIVVSSHFIVNNILEGLIWFFVPASLVICNDVMAYVCGKLFGKTPLIKLSPKKTVEGFVGAFLCTLLFALIWGTFLMRYNYLICPAHDLGVNVFSNVQCDPNPVFLWQRYAWPVLFNRSLEATLGIRLPDVPYTPYHLHLLVMATFASLAAPFGGFFASGFKRAFDIKDFGHSIPGHGGMTDRMDCQ
ncbi:hypothetical protein NliqN6_0998 [Naganishia liquefaciens]|uniref:Phosphatidate cytidylyltransferase n=1 Tax=Naganishia liquefaciens TaxID=104408 RepID=A0A8H3YEB4_9TREE|nr:hypothetical protein NliqN6_0998 [Naganishia liquefaciens]